MTYTIWVLFNVVAGLIVLYIFYRLTKAINYKFGRITAILFVVGIISISCLNKRVVDNYKVWTFKTSENVKYFQQEYSKDLVDREVFKLSLYLISLNDLDKKQEQPLKAFPIITGLVGYHSWKTQNLTIAATKHTFKYSVTGQLDWKLLGFVVYKQNKMFVGDIPKKI